MYKVDCTIQVPDIRDINRSTLKFVLRHAFMDTSDTINDSNLFTRKIDISDFVVKSIIKDRDCRFSLHGLPRQDISPHGHTFQDTLHCHTHAYIAG